DGDYSNDFRVDRDAPARYHGGDWQGIIDHLDYLDDLGVTTLWITPVVKNIEEDAGIASYHGYWTQDFLSTNPHFGDLAKLRELVDACHARGIKVILDIVTNHVGQLFYYDINLNGRPDEAVYGDGVTSPLTRVTEYDPDFDPAGIQAFTSLGNAGPAPVRWIWDPAVNRVPPEPPEFANPDWYNKRGRIYDYGDPLQVVTGDFPGGLKDLDTTRDDVRAALLDVFTYWIGAAGFDGFRIDTVKHVEHEFWRGFCTGVRDYCASIGKEKFFMFGEAFDGDDALIGSYTFDDELDSVFYFSHKFRVVDDVFKWGSSPTSAIETLFNERAVNYSGAPNAGDDGLPATRELVGFLDNHDVPRWLNGHPAADPTAALRGVMSYLLTIDGIPCIYYGTEQELAGGNDPSNREDLWDTGYDTTGETFVHLRTLIRLRKAYTALRRGDMTIRWSTDRFPDSCAPMARCPDAGIFAFERSCSAASGCDPAADTTVLVVVNAEDDAGVTDATALGFGAMATSFPAGTALVNVLPDDDPADAFTVGAGGTLSVPVPGRGAKILVPAGAVVPIE
ncbi:MAG TPA: alpha-amylase family glycosyl hydrolase, partial [Myxococcota bacterium]|nr:alpha-amylase family glycosyl hydrolase [Myxococcota bacterium]